MIFSVTETSESSNNVTCLQMPPRQDTEEDTRSDDDLHTAGAWAQGLSKGVFAHKKSSKKRTAKSPSRKQSRFDKKKNN